MRVGVTWRDLPRPLVGKALTTSKDVIYIYMYIHRKSTRKANKNTKQTRRSKEKHRKSKEKHRKSLDKPNR